MTNVFVRGVSVTARCLTTLLIAGGFLLNVSAKTDGQSTSAVASERPYVSENILARSVLLDITYAGPRLITVGQRGHIFYSDNQGESWRKAQVPVSATLTSVYFVDASNGWAAGHQGVILRSKDGGVTWQQQLNGAGVNQLVLRQTQQRFDQLSLQAALTTSPQSKSPQIMGELEELEQQLYDASSFVAEGATRPFLDILFVNKDLGYAIGAFGMFVHTTDGGETWQPWQDHLPNPDLFHLNAIIANNDQLFIAAEAGNLYQLTSNDEQWQSLELPYDGSIFGLNTDSNQHLIAFGLRGNVFVQQPTAPQENGRQWQRIDIDSDVSLFGGVVMQNKTLSLLSASGEVIVLNTDANTNSTVQGRYKTGGKLPLSAGIQTPDGELLLVGGSGLLHFSIDNTKR